MFNTKYKQHTVKLYTRHAQHGPILMSTGQKLRSRCQLMGCLSMPQRLIHH